MLGLPAIAVSQQLLAREREARAENLPPFDHVASFVARLVERLERRAPARRARC